MTVDKTKLKARAEQLMSEHSGAEFDPIPAIPVAASDVLALLAEIDQLKAENEQLRKDAERYRFVRKDVSSGAVDFCVHHTRWRGESEIITGDDCDDRIDTAMSKQSLNKKTGD
jgi:FtsZ-binding cell division protein ZapB